MHAYARTVQVESVRHSRRDVVLLVGSHCVEDAKAFNRAGIALNVLSIVAVVHHSAEHTDLPRIRLWITACVLQSEPRQLEQLPLLRVRELSFTRRDAEEVGVKQIRRFDHAASSDVGRISSQLLRDARIQLMTLKKCDSLYA